MRGYLKGRLLVFYILVVFFHWGCCDELSQAGQPSAAHHLEGWTCKIKLLASLMCGEGLLAS